MVVAQGSALGPLQGSIVVTRTALKLIATISLDTHNPLLMMVIPSSNLLPREVGSARRQLDRKCLDVAAGNLLSPHGRGNLFLSELSWTDLLTNQGADIYITPPSPER